MSGLQVEGLRKSYGDTLAVDNVSFGVAPGAIVGFVGPNGAGKSTALRIVTGLLRPDAGRVSLDGIDLRSSPHAYRSRFGALIESPAMYPMLTALAHLEYLARLRGTFDRTALREVLRTVGLDPDSPKVVRQFSLGMKQRLGIAMAIFSRPSLLVLDEPMNGLDPSGIAELREFIRTVPERTGASVLISSHLLGEIEQTCDRVLFLRHGHIVGDSPLSRSDGSLVSMRVRTSDDARTLQVLTEAPFVLEAEAQVAGGVRCRMAASDVALLAPLLVRHQLALMELGPAQHELEAMYRAHFSADEEGNTP